MRLFKISNTVLRTHYTMNAAFYLAIREAERMYFLHQIPEPFNRMPRKWRLRLIREMLPSAEAYLIINPHILKK